MQRSKSNHSIIGHDKRADWHLRPTTKNIRFGDPHRVARPDALGPHTLVVVQAAQGDETRDLQRACRDGHGQADVP